MGSFPYNKLTLNYSIHSLTGPPFIFGRELRKKKEVGQTNPILNI